MNEQQREIIEGFGQGQAVIAGAGCGKTTTLVAKCVRLLQLNPKARFCAVSFTEKSVRDLKQSLARGFQEAKASGSLTHFDQHDHWIKTIHGLGFSIVQEFPEAAGLAGGERILMEDEAERLWKRSLDQLWRQNDNIEITEAVSRVMRLYSKPSVESLLWNLKNLESFGIEKWIREPTQIGSAPAQPVRTVLADLWRIFESVRTRFSRYKQRAGAIDFNDLEVFADRALDQASVRRYYQKRFDLVLVDEFQDTNPMQGKILEKFVREGFTNLCIVGDPKQSIYRFRDADLTVFQDLTERLARRHLLTTNYRSRPAIIDFVNTVCEPVFTASEMDYEPLLPGREAGVEAQTGPQSQIVKLEIHTEMELAQFLKTEANAGRDLSEYVLLARSVNKDKTLAYLKAFESAGVPYLLGSGGRFYSDPRVIELVAFLKGWASSQNTLSQVVALRSPWMDVSDEDLMAWKTAGINFFEAFFAVGAHPIAAELGAWYQTKAVVRPGQILERLWGMSTMSEEMLLPIATLWQKVEDLSAGGSRFDEIVDQLHRWVENEKIENDIPPPDQKGAVRVMTVHASKGLQFPRVILIDLEIPRRADGRKQLLWNRKHGVYLFERDEEGQRLKDHEGNERWKELEQRAEVAESKRVFYVALTRAQEAIYLVWKKKQKEDYKERDVDLARDYWRGWIEHTGAKLVSSLSVGTDAAALNSSSLNSVAMRSHRDDSIAVPRPTLQVTTSPFRPRHSPSEWLILQQCALRYHFEFSSVASELETVRDDTDEERGADFGSSRSGSSFVADQGKKVHKLIEEEKWSELALEFKTPEIGHQIVNELRAALGQSEEQSDERGALANSAGVRVFKEVGFEVPLSSDEALVGVMDRMTLASGDSTAGDDETVQITDYKWTGSARSREKLLEHYLLQLQLYGWAAHRMTNAKKIRARLIHFTADSISVVDAPDAAFETAGLEQLVQNYFETAKKMLFEPLLLPRDVARPGDHCRYCPHQRGCPVSAASVPRANAIS